jgi:hypothetical protein
MGNYNSLEKGKERKGKKNKNRAKIGAYSE